MSRLLEVLVGISLDSSVLFFSIFFRLEAKSIRPTKVQTEITYLHTKSNIAYFKQRRNKKYLLPKVKESLRF
jgi:hypothetical protein